MRFPALAFAVLASGSAAMAADDPALVGVWRLATRDDKGEWKLVFDLSVPGSFRLEIAGPVAIPTQRGAFEAGNGRWRTVPVQGAPDQGTYVLVGRDGCRFEGKAGAFVWTRDPPAAGPGPGAAPAPVPAGFAALPSVDPAVVGAWEYTKTAGGIARRWLLAIGPDGMGRRARHSVTEGRFQAAGGKATMGTLQGTDTLDYTLMGRVLLMPSPFQGVRSVWIRTASGPPGAAPGIDPGLLGTWETWADRQAADVRAVMTIGPQGRYSCDIVRDVPIWFQGTGGRGRIMGGDEEFFEGPYRVGADGLTTGEADGAVTMARTELPASSPAAGTMDELLRVARLEARGELAQAAGALDALIAQHPGADALAARGELSLGLERTQAALGDFEAALALDARHARARADRGFALVLAGRAQDGWRDLDAALALDPTDPVTWCHRADAFLRAGQVERAIHAYERGRGLDPPYARIRVAQGIRLVDEALAKAPADPDRLLVRGRLWFLFGATDPARADFDEAIRLRPGFAAAYTHRGMCFPKQSLDAWNDFNHALQLDPRFGYGYMVRAQNSLPSRSYEDVIKDFDAALACDPGLIKAWLNRADRKMKYVTPFGSGKHEAVLDYTRAIELDPYFEKAFHNRGLNYFEMGDPEKDPRSLALALADLTRAIELNPRLVIARVHRCYCNFRMGRKAEAEADMLDAVRLDPATYFSIQDDLPKITALDEHLRWLRKSLEESFRQAWLSPGAQNFRTPTSSAEAREYGNMEAARRLEESGK